MNADHITVLFNFFIIHGVGKTESLAAAAVNEPIVPATDNEE